MPCATALSQLSRISWVIVFTPFKSPVRRWPCHRPEHGRPRTPAREGGSGNLREWCAAQGAKRVSHGPADCRCGGEAAGTAFPPSNRIGAGARRHCCARSARSEEHRSELQSLMRISYAVFCLKNKKTNIIMYNHYTSSI